MNSIPIEELIRKYLPITKSTSRGWEKFDAPCCTHNGETRDRRSRGNIIFSSSGISYNCYNCQYRASWKDSSPIVGKKITNLISWMGASNDEIYDMKNQMRTMFNDGDQPRIKRTEYVHLSFNDMDLPKNAKKIDYWLNQENIPEDFLDVISYLHKRGNRLFYNDTYYWTPIKEYNLNRRVIIPFYWENKLVGYTARSIDPNEKIRYLNFKQQDYIFNTEKIKEDHKFIMVTEGPLDALSINGIAVLGGNMTTKQVGWLKQQKKEIIIIPDGDSVGGNLKKIAIKNSWTLARPDWLISKTYKDVADAVKNLGAAYVVADIIKCRKDSDILNSIPEEKLNV